MSAQSAGSIMWLTILLDASVKGVIVLALAGALSVALRRASAASRNLVWSLALVSLIGLPALSAVLPSWQVPILPHQVPPSESQAVQEGRSAILADIEEETPAGRMPGLPVSMGYSDTAPGAMMSGTATPSPAGVELMTRGPARLPWPVWIFLAWVLGGVGAIVPLLIGIVAVLGRTRRAAQVKEGVCAKLLPVLSEELDVRRRVRLLESDDASVPTTWGVLRPVVLLPSEARNWPEERCRMVLLHELSHIRRRDWLTQTVGRVACALHWFNPLVWLAARRLRLESEQACDDALLRAGYKASGYAHQLMELVRTLRPARCASLATVPMARSSRIEKRLTAILDVTRNRRALTHLSIALALILVSCTVMPLAALRPIAKAQEPSTESKVTLPNGVTVELIGVSYHPSREQPWWRPDGTLLEEGPYDEVRANVNVGDDQQAREFAVRVGNIPGFERDYLCRVNIIGPSSQVAMSGLYKKGLHVPDLQAIAASLRQHQTTVGVGVGVAAGSWETVASSAGKGVRSADRASGGVVFAEPYEVESQTRITVSNTLVDFDCRVIAVDTDGEPHMPSARRGRAGTMRQTTASFHNLALSDIREFRFQARPFSWVEFKNVSLKPGERTDVSVVATSDAHPFRIDTSTGEAEEASVAPEAAPAVENEEMLKQVGLALKMYAGESQGGRFPAKASEAGSLHPEMEGLVHLLDEGGADASELIAYLKGQRGVKVCYLGYVVTDEEFGLALLEELSGRTELDLPQDLYISRPEGGYDTIYLLREGIERFLITDINDPAGSAITQSAIPIIWEIPDSRDGNGGWVLYMDGHVERKSYPGEYPMTERFITRLRELMASQAADESAPLPRAAASGVRARSPVARATTMGRTTRRPTSAAGTVEQTAPAASDLPQLRYLAWQTEKGQEEPVKYWRPDGRVAVNEDEITMVETWVEPTGQVDGSHPEYRHMHFWFAHPEIDRLSYFEATLLDSDGRPFEDLGSAGSTHPAGERTGNVGWHVVTRSLGAADDWPERVRIRVRYGVGPWEYRRTVPPDYNGFMALDNNASLGSIGQNTEGRTFISSIQDTDAVTVQFDFVAVTKDGREIERTRLNRAGPPQSLQETYIFDEPLANVKEFKLRVRPIKTVTLKDVSLVPGRLTGTTVVAGDTTPRRGAWFAWRGRATRPAAAGVPRPAAARRVGTTARRRPAATPVPRTATARRGRMTARRRPAPAATASTSTTSTVGATARRSPVARTTTTTARASSETEQGAEITARPLTAADREIFDELVQFARIADRRFSDIGDYRWRAALYHVRSENEATVWEMLHLRRRRESGPDEVGWECSRRIDADAEYYLPDGTPLNSRWEPRDSGMHAIYIDVGTPVPESERVQVVSRHGTAPDQFLIVPGTGERRFEFWGWTSSPRAWIVRLDAPLELGSYTRGRPDIWRRDEYTELTWLLPLDPAGARGYVNFTAPREAGSAQPVYETALATKESRERFNYERVLNRELTHMISSLDFVRSAQVRVTIPEDALFEEEQEDPRASVLVELAEQGALEQHQTDAIRHLVAAGVEDLKESNITVVDTQGNVLAVPGVQEREQAIKGILDYGGFVKYDGGGRVVRVNLVYDEDESGNRTECRGTSDDVLAYLPILSETRELLIHGSQATDRAMQYVGQLKNLEKLYMWDAEVSDKGALHLANLRGLSHIHISNANITDATLKILAPLPELEGMSLQGNNFTDEGLKHLRDMTQLKALWVGLGHGRITDAGMTHLAALSKLRRLDLQNTSVTDAGLQKIRGLTNLRALYLHGTHVTPAGAREIQAAIPDLNVDFR